MLLNVVSGDMTKEISETLIIAQSTAYRVKKKHDET